MLSLFKTRVALTMALGVAAFAAAARAQLRVDLLDVSHNRITSLPPELGALTKAAVLADHNQIERLPDDLRNVRTASFVGNPIPSAEERRFREGLDPKRQGAFRIR